MEHTSSITRAHRNTTRRQWGSNSMDRKQRTKLRLVYVGVGRPCLSTNDPIRDYPALRIVNYSNMLQ